MISKLLVVNELQANTALEGQLQLRQHSIFLKERLVMQQFLLWPTLTILAGASATIPVVQNSYTRNLLYWLVLSPIAVGLLSVVCMGIR